MNQLSDWSRCPACGTTWKAELGEPCPKCHEEEADSILLWETFKGLFDWPSTEDFLYTVKWMIIVGVVVLAIDRVIRWMA